MIFFLLFHYDIFCCKMLLDNFSVKLIAVQKMSKYELFSCSKVNFLLIGRSHFQIMLKIEDSDHIFLKLLCIAASRKNFKKFNLVGQGHPES